MADGSVYSVVYVDAVRFCGVQHSTTPPRNPPNVDRLLPKGPRILQHLGYLKPG